MRRLLIISLMIITLVCTSVMPVFANDEPVIVYTSVDLTEYATGKFWMDPDDSTETATSNYSHIDYAYNGSDSFCVAVYPMAFRTGTAREQNGAYGTKYPPQQGTISSTDGATTITSLRSDVTYTMPAKTETAAEKEAIILNEYWADSKLGTTIKQKTINVEGQYNSLYFLVGSATLDNAKAKITAVVKYTDGTESSLTNAEIPAGNFNGQVSDNFVADIARVGFPNFSTAFSKTFVDLDSKNRALSLYEYSLELDPEKTVQDITFSTSRSTTTPNIAIVSVAMAYDWRAKLDTTAAAIDAAMEDNDDIDKILTAIKCVNEVKKSGLDLEEYIDNYAEFNLLFSDGAAIGEKLLQGLLENSYVDWDSTEDIFSQIESIISAIADVDAHYGDLSEDLRAKCEDTYEQMVEVMLNADKEEELLKARSELLKSTQIKEFQDIFAQKVIYVQEYKKELSHEDITFSFIFSQIVDANLFNSETIKISYGNKSVNPAWVSYIPKEVDGEIRGVMVKIINSQDYTDAYNIVIDSSMVGSNGGKWVYEEHYSEKYSAPFVYDISGVTVSETAIGGSITLSNHLDKPQEYTLLLAAYSKTGELLAAKPFKGSISKNASDNKPVEFSLPADAEKVVCIVVDNYTDMTFLSPTSEIKLN